MIHVGYVNYKREEKENFHAKREYKFVPRKDNENFKRQIRIRKRDFILFFSFHLLNI